MAIVRLVYWSIVGFAVAVAYMAGVFAYVYRRASFPVLVAWMVLTLIFVFPDVGRWIAFGVLTVLLIFEVEPPYRSVPIIALPTVFLWLIGREIPPGGPAMPLAWLGACAIWYGGPVLRRRQ